MNIYLVIKKIQNGADGDDTILELVPSWHQNSAPDLDDDDEMEKQEDNEN